MTADKNKTHYKILLSWYGTRVYLFICIKLSINDLQAAVVKVYSFAWARKCVERR